MKKIVSICFILNILCVHILNAQQKIFNVVTRANAITGFAQDRQGYIWYGSANDGLFRYDGSKVVSFTNNPKNSNSLASNNVFSIVIDKENIIWIGTSGGGLDRYDPVTNTFTHFRHNSKDKASLSNDTVFTILQDRSGNIWVGTYGGLDLFNYKTGGFTHYANNPADLTSLSHNHVWTLYEDRQGTLWVGCGSSYTDRDKEKPEEGGLNRLDKRSGKFTRYLHDPANPYSIANNKIRAIFEDSKNNFWVGTAGDGLHTLDRGSGKFTHYYYNPSNPESLSRPPVYHVRDSITLDIITFIHEDARGFIWIGTLQSGINQYNPATKKAVHHGYLYKQNKRITTDTLSGFKDETAWNAFTSKDGLLWIAASEGVYSVNPFPTPVIPYITLREGTGIVFYEEENGTFWIGTNSGIIRNDKKTGTQKKFSHDPDNLNSLSNNEIHAIEPDSDGKFWITTDGGGLNKFDPLTQTFTRYLHDTKKGSLSSNRALKLYFDRNKDLWVSTWDSGLNKLDSETGFFTSYQHDSKDSTSLSHNRVNNMVDDSTGDLWVATHSGLNRLNKKNGKFKRYLINTRVNSIWVDKKNIIWIGAVDGLYRYDRTNDRFLLYTVNDGWPKIDKVLNIIEDDQKSLWVRNTNALYRISESRSEVRIYGSEQGMQKSPWGFTNSYKTKAGKIFIAEQDGYYAFSPEQTTGSSYPPQINITSFQLGDVEVKPGKNSVLSEPVYKAKEISLRHNQNSFSIGFWAINYTSPGEEKYQYMLENYDNVWHDAGDERKAYFFNVPPGHYTFRVRAMNSDGVWSEKKLPIVVHPPWWQTPWAITLFIVCFIAIVWAFAYYRSRSLRKENLLLEEKVNQRTAQLKQSLEELKSTQTQLIHSEKMASLGELTAGIAHEIQNPLNFVNNFSEVNQEMVDEATEEIDKGNIEEVKNILSDIKDNSEKIIYHGKRADAIVKGMLQHSRTSTGQKEPTDINKLADEYLRLSYHGTRAKDKEFNVDIKTDFDETIGKINVIPQDIGRVLLNLFNNAFYAVNEKMKQAAQDLSGFQNLAGLKQYQPQVKVSTRKLNDKIEISVEDNGNGIPQNIVGKIFQPFFTTKPTGQGTGLGLSLSYDIIKAHGGEIKVETKEGEGTNFIIQLPVS